MWFGGVFMYEDIIYNTNYVEEVICRLDFASPIDELKKSMPKAIFDVVKQHYPIAEPQDVIGTELNINPDGGAAVNRIVKKQWVFLSRDRMAKCVIEPENVVFTIRNYNVFEELENVIIDILNIVMDTFQGTQGKRFGLRYVNNIPIKEHGNWIEDKFFSALSAHKDDKTTKLLTTLEYAVAEKDLNVRLVYGYNNPDYPAVMKREDFIIDIDAYTTGIIYQEDISQCLSDMHFEDQNCFEKMITEEFRNAANFKE